jgi:phage tail-like protein
MADFEPAVTVCFQVSIDQGNLGTFYSCEGLGCEVVLEQREEGGLNGMVWQLPKGLKYPNIKLTRPVGPDTALIAAWFASMNSTYTFRTAVISACTADNSIVAQWSLDGVIPVRWTGPSLNLDSPKVATETLEIAYHGFTMPSTSAAS